MHDQIQMLKDVVKNDNNLYPITNNIKVDDTTLIKYTKPLLMV